MESSDIKEPLTKEDLDKMVEEYYELDKRIDNMDKYEQTFLRGLNISNAHYRMVETQIFAMLAYAQVLRMRLEDYGIEV